MDTFNTYTKPEKVKLLLTGITAILSGIPFLVYTAFAVKDFIVFVQNPADPTLILITMGMAYLFAYILYFGAIGGCLLGFCAFLACGITNLTALRKYAPRAIPVSIHVVFAFDIAVLAIGSIPLFICLWHLVVYGDASTLPDCAVIGVPFVLALVNLIINRAFVFGIKRALR